MLYVLILVVRPVIHTMFIYIIVIFLGKDCFNNGFPFGQLLVAVFAKITIVSS